PVPARSLQANVPRDLETVCHKCLHKEPARRYASAAELADDLRRFLSGEPVNARRVGAVGRVLRWAKRRPAVATLTAGILLAISVGTALVLWNWIEAVHQREEAVAAAGRERVAKEEVARKAEELRLKAEAEREAKEDARAKAERAEQNLYLNRIVTAQREWESNRVRSAMNLLDACPAGRRGWEWRYLRRLCHGTPLTMLGHP